MTRNGQHQNGQRLGARGRGRRLLGRRLLGRRLMALVGLGILMSAGLTALGWGTDARAEAPAGLHTQPWMAETFLDLKEDLEEAQAAGKGLIVAFEQAGCPYCRELHRVNFQDDELVSYLNENFVFVQIDLRGGRETTDFDGTALSEKQLSRRWRVVFTPTILLFSKDQEIDDSQIGRDQIAALMPGYFKPFHFRTMLEYVADDHYKSKHFQAFVDERAKALRAEGKKVKVW